MTIPTHGAAAGPGGGADIMARTVQGIVTKHSLMKQPMVVINKAGGAGGEGFLDVKNSRNNPHKIIITLSNLFTTPLATGIPFNWKDLTPVAMLALDEFVLWVNAEKPYKTANEYIDAAKKANGTFKMGGTGSKQEDQIITEAIQKQTGAKFIYIPQRGGGAVAVQLVGNHVDSTVNNPNEAVAHWRAGKVRPLCVFDAKPMPYKETIAEGKSWGDVPTCKSQGLDIEYLMLRGIFIGMVLGVLIGVLPGLGGANGVAILLPLTFSMPPTSAIIMLSASTGARCSAAPSPRSCSTFRASRGRWRPRSTAIPWRSRAAPGEALTAAFTSSFVGALFAVVLITLPRAAGRRFRAEVRAAGVLRRLFPGVLQFRRHEQGAALQDHRAMMIGFALARWARFRDRAVAPDLRLRVAAERLRLPDRRHRPVRHRRDPAHDGGGAQVQGRQGQDQPARGAADLEGTAALLG
jgi:tripartite-type tricarboxylate transporter receptor subunit TctC